jgi:hydroxyacylglutathione hydrolase
MELFGESGYRIARVRIKGSDSNYNYIVWCAETLECAVIDPLDAKVVLDFIKRKGLTVKYIINTHTHPDHIGGNYAILKSTGATILVHPKGQGAVSSKNEPIEEGGVVYIGKQKINVMHTPGHCPEHISLVFGENVFVGDTLFLSGCGNTKFGGNIDELYNSIAIRLRPLPDGFKVFEEVRSAYSQGKEPAPTTIGEEKKYNPFLRFDVPELVVEMKRRKPSIGNDPRIVFKELRELRNDWH